MLLLSMIFVFVFIFKFRFLQCSLFKRFYKWMNDLQRSSLPPSELDIENEIETHFMLKICVFTGTGCKLVSRCSGCF